MDNKYKLLLRTKLNMVDIDAEELDDETRSFAQHLISTFDQRTTWNQLKVLKDLSYFIDYPLVRDGLMGIYRRSTNPQVKKAIKDLYEGKIDTTADQDYVRKFKSIIDTNQEEMMARMRAKSKAKAVPENEKIKLKLARFTDINT